MIDKLRQISARLLQDKKQTGMVLGLSAVGLLLWGRLLLKQVPQTASADDTPQWLQEVEAELRDAPLRRVTVRLPRIGPIAGDPFMLDPSRYTRTLSEDSVLKQAKSGGEVTDEARQMAVVQAAGELKLQSLTQGEVPAAFINGRLIRVGASIDGFTLLSCDERSAVLIRDGIRVRLNIGGRRPR